MQIVFSKYHGTGNDFILLDDRERVFEASTDNIAKLCDRHFGIGSDGLLLLRNSEQYDFEMVYFNSDGSPATFCGNGGRCMVAFASQLGLIKQDCIFKAADGVHHASIINQTVDEWVVKLEMQDAMIYEHCSEYTYLNSGTYHYVSFVDDPGSCDLVSYARKIRYDKKFAPHGTNVNLVKAKGNNLFVRTYEKGVEDETLSCGTGVTAAAIAASIRYGGNHWYILTKGGKLEVGFERDDEEFKKIYLQGPACRVFEGLTSI